MLPHLTDFLGDAFQETVQLVLDHAAAFVHVFGHGHRVRHRRQGLAAGALRQIRARRQDGGIVADWDGRGQRGRDALGVGQVC